MNLCLKTLSKTFLIKHFAKFYVKPHRDYMINPYGKPFAWFLRKTIRPYGWVFQETFKWFRKRHVTRNLFQTLSKTFLPNSVQADVLTRKH